MSQFSAERFSTVLSFFSTGPDIPCTAYADDLLCLQPHTLGSQPVCTFTGFIGLTHVLAD